MNFEMNGGQAIDLLNAECDALDAQIAALREKKRVLADRRRQLVLAASAAAKARRLKPDELAALAALKVTPEPVVGGAAAGK